MRTRGLTVVALLSCTLLTGCSDAGRDPGRPSPSTPTTSPTASTELPDSAAGRQAGWVLEQLDAEPGTPLRGAQTRFTAEFLGQVSVEELTGIVDDLRALRPWQVVRVEEAASTLVARITGTGQELDLQVTVDGEGLIAGLFFAAPTPDREPAADAAALLDEVADVPRSSLLVARVVDGACVPVDGLAGGSAEGEQLPIGSMVKLYVLGAVVDAVERGDLTWDTGLTVRDELKSLPSGTLQDEPAGTVVTVQEAAAGMIGISDNTATDLLIDAVGRDAVERAMADMGHADPAANLPLATTRELFHLGWGGGDELRERWRDAEEAGRRAVLAELPPGPPAVDPAEMVAQPVWQDDVDWFATADDVCAAHAGLAERAATPAGAPVREILGANPGLEVDDAWAYVGFKGGSSIGTMAGSWYAEPAAGGDPVVVVLQSAADDQAGALAASSLAGIAADALRFALD